MSKIQDEAFSYEHEVDSLEKLLKYQQYKYNEEPHDQVETLDNDETSRDVQHRQLLNLPDPGNNPRYEVADIAWPDEELVPSICMWHDDKLAAFSISIDDNHVEDHAFWLQMAATYGWKITWFVITNNIGSMHDDWPQWQNLINQGHEVQSHTCSHLCDGLYNIRKEYQQSQSIINGKLQNNKAVTIAYPFGIKTRKDGSPCAAIPSKNNRGEAARRYIAARDVVGALSNPAKIDFMKVPSISNMRNFFCQNCNWAYFDSLLDPNSQNYRTWYSAHFHHVHDSQLQAEIRRAFNHIRQKQAQIWVGKFSDIAKYAQEFATASIQNLRDHGTQLTFDLRDEMNDYHYDFPLTVKILLPRSWGNRITATQNNQTIDCEVLNRHGKHYALIHAVPDKGRIKVVKR